MRSDLMRIALLYGAGRESSEAKDEGGLLESARIECVHKDGVFPDQGAMGNSVGYSLANAATIAYAVGQLAPFGPRAEPPPKPTLKSGTAPLHTPLCDRKKELRQIIADKARGRRLIKRLKSRKPQAFEFSNSHEAKMEINGQSFPIKNVRLTLASDG